MSEVAGVRADKKTGNAEPQGSGSGLLVVGGGYGSTSPSVYSYDVDGTLLATYDEGEGAVAFGTSQETDFMSAEIDWNPSNSGTLICVGTGTGTTGRRNAINGIGSRSIDTSGDLRFGLTQSGSTFTAYQAFMEFPTTGLPPALGGTINGFFSNQSSTDAVSPGRIQCQFTLSGTSAFSYFALDYGTVATGPWVPLDAGNLAADDRTVDDAPYMPATAVSLSPSSGTITFAVLRSMITGRRSTRFVFIGRASTSLPFGLGTISRSTVKLKYMINRRGLRSVQQVTSGIVVRAYY